MSETFQLNAATVQSVPSSAKVTTTVYNAGPGAVYYKKSRDVSASSKDGTLTTGQSETFSDGPRWLVSTNEGTRVFISHTPDATTDMATQTELESLPRALGEGSKTAPALAPATNTDTGLYFYNEGNQIGLALNGETYAYLNTDGTLVLTGSTTPTKLTSGTARGTMVIPNNRFYRSQLADGSNTERLIGNNSANEIIIGGERGAGDQGDILIRATRTEIRRGADPETMASVLNAKEDEVELPKKLTVGEAATFKKAVTVEEAATFKAAATFQKSVTQEEPGIAKKGIQSNYGTNGSGSSAFETKVEGDTQNRLTILNNGNLNLRDGSSATAVVLSCPEAGAYKVEASKYGIGVAPAAIQTVKKEGLTANELATALAKNGFVKVEA